MLIRQDQQLRQQIDTSTETSDAGSSQSNETPDSSLHASKNHQANMTSHHHGKTFKRR